MCHGCLLWLNVLSRCSTGSPGSWDLGNTVGLLVLAWRLYALDDEFAVCLPIRKNTLQLDSLQHYELTAKTLKEKIELKELGTILFQYNRLRGYAGGGDEELEKKNSSKDEDQDSKNSTKFIIY